MATGGGTDRHVLIVEDDPPVRQMVADVLHDAGFSVVQAADGGEALRLLGEAQPDLVVLDLMLPGVSGWEFLEQSRPHLDRARIPVIILSAIKGQGDYPSTLGVAAWLNKPLDVESFLRAVEDLCGARRPPLPGAGQAGTQRVLLVEDDQTIRIMLVEHLSGEGYEVDSARTLAEAGACIASAPPAMIVLDLMLPGRTGWEFLRERRANPQLAAIPVVVISAAPYGLLIEAKELGANAFLAKPFDLEVLTTLVRSFLG